MFNNKIILPIIILSILAIFKIYDIVQFIDIIRAIGLMTCGFGILAGFYYIKNGNWNGYSQLKKLEVIFAMFVAISILLITVPETTVLLKTLGITMDTEGTGRILYILIGVYISKIVENKTDVNLQFKPLLEKSYCTVDGCPYGQNNGQDDAISVNRSYTNKVIDNGIER